MSRFAVWEARMKIELRGTDGQSRQFERVVLPLPRDLIERPVVYAFVRLNESGDFRVISIDEALTPGEALGKVEAAQIKGANCAVSCREDDSLARRDMVANFRKVYSV
jgi:hypothetical protein